jgi:hypothetical protein
MKKKPFEREKCSFWYIHMLAIKKYFRRRQKNQKISDWKFGKD